MKLAIATRPDIMRCCKSCDREMCQPYCERCGVYTRTEDEELADAEAFDRRKADEDRFVALFLDCFR